jgi:hypothetical protein
MSPLRIDFPRHTIETSILYRTMSTINYQSIVFDIEALHTVENGGIDYEDSDSPDEDEPAYAETPAREIWASFETASLAHDVA